MENVKVAYDGTVRDAANRVIQFRYGDDGGDGMFVEHVRVPRGENSQWIGSRQSVDVLINVDELWTLVPKDLVDSRSLPTPSESSAWMDGLLKRLRPVLGDNPLVEALLQRSFPSERIRTLHPRRLEFFGEMLVEECRRRMVTPNEMVGVLAAQSISE